MSKKKSKKVILGNIPNHWYFDNVNSNTEYEQSNRLVDLDKPSPSITTHFRDSHVIDLDKAKKTVKVSK